MALAQIKKAVINRETLDAEKKNAMAILSHVLKNVIDLLHPVMPFITEELNGILFQGSELVISRAWPKADESLVSADIEKKLSNEKFVSGAPEAVVNAERTKLATQQDIIAKCQKALAELQ